MLMGVICGVEMGLGLAGVPHQSGGGGRNAVPCAVKLTPEKRNKPEKDMKKYNWQPLLLSSQLLLQHHIRCGRHTQVRARWQTGFIVRGKRECIRAVRQR